MTKTQQDSITYMGVNMDAVNMLLEFMEKRLDRVSQHSFQYSFFQERLWKWSLLKKKKNAILV